MTVSFLCFFSVVASLRKKAVYCIAGDSLWRFIAGRPAAAIIENLKSAD